MSRASYVYVVQWKTVPVAGFTVKYELQQWLERQARDALFDLDEFSVTRMRDGGFSPERNASIPIAELIKGEGKS